MKPQNSSDKKNKKEEEKERIRYYVFLIFNKMEARLTVYRAEGSLIDPNGRTKKLTITYLYTPLV